MYAKELIGKNAVRTKSVTKSYGIDNSFITSPIKIVKVTDTHIIYKYSEHYTGVLAHMNDIVHLLSFEYLDDNWVDYDELINLEKSVSDIAESIITKRES